MNWIEIAAIAMLLIGIGAGGFLVAQRPTFWLGLASASLKAVLPFIVKYVGKRMSPEKEKEWHDCIRRGGEWDHVRKRCKR